MAGCSACRESCKKQTQTSGNSLVRAETESTSGFAGQKEKEKEGEVFGDTLKSTPVDQKCTSIQVKYGTKMFTPMIFENEIVL